MTYQMNFLMGIGSINLVPSRLFRQVALLNLNGYTRTEMQVGFCQRWNLAAGPMHKNTLADAAERLAFGFKLLIVREVKLWLVVPAKVVPIN